MKLIDPRSLDTAFLAPGTATFSECLARLEDRDDITPTRRRDLASALRQLARLLDRPLDELPTDPVWLRPRIARIEPAAHDMSPKTWSNILSNSKAAFRLLGIVEGRTRPLKDLSPLWAELWKSVRESGDQSLAPALGRFVRFLDNLKAPPDAVTEDHIDAYRKALEVNELRRDPDGSARQAAFAWNLAAQRIDTWPDRCLRVPSRSQVYALSEDAFPPSFTQDLRRYLARLRDPDPLDDTAPARPLRTATITHHRAQILRFASALVHSGFPVVQVVSVATLCNAENFRKALRWILDRNDGKPTKSLGNLVYLLQSIAQHYVGSSQANIDCIRIVLKRLDNGSEHGLTEKNRERLRPFEDKDALRKLLTLPEQLAKEARAREPAYKSCLKMELAVAIAILRICPIRRTNLVELNLEQDLRRMNGGRAFLVFHPSNVKNSRPIEFELPEDLVIMIEEHVSRRADILCPKGTPWLFPRRDGLQPMDKSSLSNRVSAIIRKSTGLAVNLHLFRHLAAKIVLDMHPGHYELVRRLLGHAELSSTLNAYAGFEAGTATRLFAEIVEKARGAGK